MISKIIFSALFLLASSLLFSQTFQEVPLSIPGINSGGTCWGDYDNDGDADIILTGIAEMTTGLSMTQLFRNSVVNLHKWLTTNIKQTGSAGLSRKRASLPRR